MTNRPRLSAELDALQEAFSDHPVNLKEIVSRTHEEAWLLAAFCLSLPFCMPIPLPLLGVPVGLTIAWIGLRIAFGSKIQIPSSLFERRLPPRFFSILIRGTTRLVRWLEKMTSRRLSFLVTGRMPFVNALLIALSGLFLTLPLPIPFSNALPALALVFLTAGSLEKDGLFVLFGYIAAILFPLFLSAITLGGWEIFHNLPA